MSDQAWQTLRLTIIWVSIVLCIAMLTSCAPEGVSLDDGTVACGDSICLETRGMTEDEVYIGGACEEGTGTGVDLSACCPDGYEAVGYCSAVDHIVACVRECEES